MKQRIYCVSVIVSVLLLFVFLECSGTVFTRNYYGLREAFDEDIPEGASTLAFVFDITGSMYDDLVQVIEGAARIFSTILARREKAIYNYVLVPFHDPGMFANISSLSLLNSDISHPPPGEYISAASRQRFWSFREGGCIILLLEHI